MFNDNWVTEVNVAVDECSSKVIEYPLLRVNDPQSDVMSNTAWVEDWKSLRNMSQRKNSYQT